jgi:adenylate cyclase
MGGIRIPIALKLATVFLILLVLSMTIATYRTTDLFKSTSGKREEDTNRSSATAKANEVNILLDGFINRSKVIGLIMISSDKKTEKGKTSAQKIIYENFYNDSSMLSVEVYQKKKSKYRATKSLFNDKLLSKEKSSSSFLKTLERKKKTPFSRIFSGKISIVNRAQRKGLKILSIGIPLVSDAKGNVSHAAVVNIKLATLQNLFTVRSEKSVYMVDTLGKIIAHKDEKKLFRPKSIAKLPSVKRATTSKLSIGQMRYSKKKQTYISAYVKAKHGLIVLSEANEQIILEPAEQLTHEVMYITGMVLAGAVFFIFIFSLTLTKPIEKLVQATQAISQGNFGFSVSAMVKSKDEVGTLALAFDSMVSGLAERDKVKGLLNKFHGSSVAEDLISNDAATKKGIRKPVVIFFSDIRSFTATSEAMEPEDVVSMLNEYFQIMVGIVIENNGIVDKFIGDAVMAVWGAPQSTGDDIYHALNASLQMRIALEKLNINREARGEAPLMIGMGLHFGDALSGTIGSDERMEYTVIGDTVNTAARVEASTKSFGTDLLVTEEIYDLVNDRFLMHKCGAAEVKGKTKPLVYYKVDGYIDPDGTKRIIETPYSAYESSGADKVKVVDT